MRFLYCEPYINNIGLQRTPSPRIFFPGSHGTSVHTDYWYGHGKTANTVWVPLLNCVPGSTFYSDHYNQLSYSQNPDTVISDISRLASKISVSQYEVLPPPSSCYIFNSSVVHGSVLNTSNLTRLSFDFRLTRIDDTSSNKDLSDYYVFNSSHSFSSQKHPLYGKNILKYIRTSSSFPTYLQHICLDQASTRLGFILNSQEAEIERFGFPVFLSLLDSSPLSRKFDAIAIASSTILSQNLIDRISTADIPVWCCLENSFL